MPRNASAPSTGTFDTHERSTSDPILAHRAPSESLARLLTLEQLSHLLQLHERTIRRLVARRRLPCVRLGRSVRFDPADVARWLAARKEG